MKRYTRIFVAAVLLAFSCGDDDALAPNVENQKPPNGMFVLEVRDVENKPVPDLRVSFWFDILCDGTLCFPRSGLVGTRTPSDAAALTTIRFELAQTSLVDLSVRSLDGAFVQQVVREISSEGPKTVAWGFDGLLPNGVYACTLLATDPNTNETLFEDSIWIVLWQPDPDVSVVGRTNADGFFATSDSLLFPNTLSLPPLDGRTVICDHFALEIGDTFTVVLTDEKSGTQQSFLAELPNKLLRITWDPPSVFSRPARPSDLHPASDGDRHIVVPGPSPDTTATVQQFRLYQNCPNPFN